MRRDGIGMNIASLHPFLDSLGLPPVDALAAMRQHGRANFAESGFPTRRHEAWKFTELRPLIEARFQHFEADAAASVEAAGDADRLVFANGRFDAAQSRIGALPDGVLLLSFADWARREPQAAAAAFDLRGGAERAFLSLNAAFVGDGAVLIVPDGVALPRPVRIIHRSRAEAPASSHVKTVLRLGAGASAKVIESFDGSGIYWSNVSASVELGAGARLGHYTLQNEAVDAFHTAHLAVTIGAAAQYDGFLLTLGARLARQDVQASLAGADAVCGYSGAYLLRGRQEAAVNSVIRHAAPGGRTRETFKGCVADRAHGVFQGKILVEPDAQKTDAHQLNKTMLLGDRAVMDSKPELEIYADDVKCSHGATVGDLDETALFYLRSRGIEPEPARRMLIEAFVLDAVDLVEDEAARDFLQAAIARRLEISEDGR
jgi:Fe-S cluster assembly protein SufD